MSLEESEKEELIRLRETVASLTQSNDALVTVSIFFYFFIIIW